MQKTLFKLRGAVLAAALAAASVAAHADIAINASFTFDNVASGSTANSTLGSWASVMSFANPDTVQDVDAFGSYTGTFHWVDATAAYGDVLVKASSAAISGTNVLANDHQPIMLTFVDPVNIASLSIQQDQSGFGFPGQTYMAFLDATGHEISGANVYYTQGGQPGLLISNNGTVNNVSAVLFSGGVDYDNLSITTVAAVPEPGTWAMMAGGLMMLGAVTRRRRG